MAGADKVAVNSAAVVRPELVADIADRFGGVPIDRSKPTGMVGSMIDAFGQHDRLYLVIPPEGTRSRTEYWKSGFYRIALGAKVPIVPGWLCYRRKRGGFGEAIEVTGDVKGDMDQLRAFYERMQPQPRYPEKFGPIRLKDELDA